MKTGWTLLAYSIFLIICILREFVIKNSALYEQLSLKQTIRGVQNFWKFVNTVERVGLRIDNIQKPLKLSFWPQAELDGPINSILQKRISKPFIQITSKLIIGGAVWLKKSLNFKSSLYGLLRFFLQKTSPISLIAGKIWLHTLFCTTLEFSCQNISYSSMWFWSWKCTIKERWNELTF